MFLGANERTLLATGKQGTQKSVVEIDAAGEGLDADALVLAVRAIFADFTSLATDLVHRQAEGSGDGGIG